MYLLLEKHIHVLMDFLLIACTTLYDNKIKNISYKYMLFHQKSSLFVAVYQFIIGTFLKPANNIFVGIL